MSSKIHADIAVIGGGASGLAAAAGALENGAEKVVIAERLEKTGRKILATGNGRCNLGNTKPSAEHYHGSVKNAAEIIAAGESAQDFFGRLGVMCTADSQGRIYPHSNSAATVLEALSLKLSQLGAQTVCGFEVNALKQTREGYAVSSADGREIFCKRVIIAAGGYAAPVFGTDGSVIRLLKEWGYETAKICPAVAPLRVRPDSVKGLKGVRAKGVVTALSGGKILAREEGEIQFTENSLSGICVFNMARLFSDYEGRLTLRLDLAPSLSRESLEEYLFCVQSLRFDCCLEQFLSGLFTAKLAAYLMKKIVNRPLTDSVSTLGYDEIHRLAQGIKALDFEVTGSSSWQGAQATSGGIHGKFIDGGLQSRLHRGVYFCGEILDVVGDCGGYNLCWSWSSGYLAGKNSALSLEKGD